MKSYSFRADGLLNAFSSGATQVNYYFDALDRRVAKVINQGGQSFTQSYVYLDREDRIFLGKAGSGFVTTYVGGQDFDEHLGEVKGGIGKGYITDHLGSVLNGEAAGTSNRFGLFGEPNSSMPLSQSSSAVSYGFAGYENDAESGNYRMPYRTYNPIVGRWLSQERLSSEGPNNYLYGKNSPAMYTDHNGLWTEPSSLEEWRKRLAANAAEWQNLARKALLLTPSRTACNELRKAIAAADEEYRNLGSMIGGDNPDNCPAGGGNDKKAWENLQAAINAQNIAFANACKAQLPF